MYGCGDSFAAGLTYGLGAGMAIEQALELARALRRGLRDRARTVRGPAALGLGHVPAGGLDRQAVRDPGLEAAGEVVRA